MRNIKEWVIPIVSGRDLINDEAWRLYVPARSESHKVALFGEYLFQNTTQDIQKYRPFKLFLQFDRSGNIFLQTVKVPSDAMIDARLKAQIANEVREVFSDLKQGVN
tara:strand:- start:41 stop:361 length:321 start_codon:yes stop_codon:yes gene_type:complete